MKRSLVVLVNLVLWLSHCNFANAETIADRLAAGHPDSSAPITPTKGGVWIAGGSAFSALTVGSNTQVLIADSTAPLGVKWGTATATPGTGVIVDSMVNASAAIDGTKILAQFGSQAIGGGSITTGVSGSIDGSFNLSTALGEEVSIQPLHAGSTWTLTLPPNGGFQSGLYLQTDGSGTTIWSNPLVGSNLTLTQPTNNVSSNNITVNNQAAGNTVIYGGVDGSNHGEFYIRNASGTNKVSMTGSNGVVTATTFTGALSGNASTATSAATLTTPRAINGVNFDGSAAITVAAAAGTLTGGTLASGVTASSLTSTGTVTSGTWSGSFGAVSGANLTTLNASNLSSGTVPAARLAVGTVFNFVKTDITAVADVTTSSSTYTTTGLVVIITPTSATDIIRISAYSPAGGPGNQSLSDLRLKFKRTIAASTTDLGNCASIRGNFTTYGIVAPVYYDSPATTAAVTYELFMASSDNANAVYWLNSTHSNDVHRIVAEEIKQ